MKYLFALVFLIKFSSVFAQDSLDFGGRYSVDGQYFYGTILQHNPDIGHLITRHPRGVLLSYNEKTYGFEPWSARYNYPDHGFSFIYQDMNNPTLGENFSVYGHFSFYFFNRKLMARIGQGIAYNTNPYDPKTNYINNAYGTHLLSTTYVMGNYKEPNILDGLGIQAGFMIVHYSNANVKAPNNSTNTFGLNVGLNYQFNAAEKPDFQPRPVGDKKYSEPIHYNFALRGGVNASDIVGQGQYPFMNFAVYADKRISHFSTFQAGLEVFFSPMLQELINYESIAYPDGEVTGNEASTRTGIFIGHQLTFNKVSFVANLGYYLTYPFDFEGRVYNRLGIQRDFGDHFFVMISVHSHGAKAEDASLSIGYRL